VRLSAAGGSGYLWLPEAEFSDNRLQYPTVAPAATSVFTVIVTDSNSCSNRDSVTVFVQQVPEFDLLNDTSVIIGETAYLSVQSGENLVYRWMEAEGIGCFDCTLQAVVPIESTTYFVTAADVNSCFEVTKDVTVTIIKDYTIDVPTAFTPDNDGLNDIVYVRGWGLKELIRFDVFNRWGEIVFQSSDHAFGWDGYFNGVLQPSDTYVYYVEAVTYEGHTLSKKGDITLIK
ncbi:MAG: gliding motility-associated C-terminal domain-containing protein, partial [Bacteroidetes bacterium]|nr:gliding motility-associated C-terminal domain-containing protein [Bacteroidota bacterium]